MTSRMHPSNFSCVKAAAWGSYKAVGEKEDVIVSRKSSFLIVLFIPLPVVVVFELSQNVIGGSVS